MLNTIRVQITNNSVRSQSETIQLFNTLQNILPTNGVKIRVFGGYQALLRELAGNRYCIESIKYTTRNDAQKENAISFTSIGSSGHTSSDTVVPSTYLSAQQKDPNVIDIPVKMLLDGRHPLTTTIEYGASVSMTLFKCRGKFAGFIAGLLRRRGRKSVVKCVTC